MEGYSTKKFIEGRMHAIIGDMILRDVLNAHGINSVTEFAQRAQLRSIQQAWNLWHGYAQVGLRLAKTISQHTGIPLAELVTLDPTPKTPARHPRSRKASGKQSAKGKGGGRRRG